MKVTKERNDHAAEEHGRATALVAMHGLCTQAHGNTWWPCVSSNCAVEQLFADVQREFYSYF